MVDELTQELFQTGSHYIYPISVYHCLKQSTGDRYHSSMDSFFFAPKQLETITPMPEESPIHNEKNKKLIMPTEPTAP